MKETGQILKLFLPSFHVVRAWGSCFCCIMNAPAFRQASDGTFTPTDRTCEMCTP